MDFTENGANKSIIKNRTEEDLMMTTSQFIFHVSVRGVLLSAVKVLVSFLNISTIVVIYKYRVLQITSNALIVCFSVGHSLAIIGGTLLLLSDYVLHRNTLAWKINCVLYTFLTVYQHGNNVLSIAAISIERAYTIYFPFHSYKFNSFGKMIKVTVGVLSFCFTGSTTQIIVGIFTENLKDTSLCTVYVVSGRYGWLFGFAVTYISSFICVSMSLLIVGKLIHRKRTQNLSTNTGPTNTEYKITKMFITGKELIVSFVITWQSYLM